MESIEKSNYRLVPCIKQCKSDQSFSFFDCPEKFVDCKIVDAIEENENTCDCVADYACQSCQSCQSEGTENDCSASEKIVNCPIFGENDKSHDCVIDNDCPGCKSKDSDGFSQQEFSTSETFVNCTTFETGEEIDNNYDCEECEGCKINDSLEDRENDRSSSGKINTEEEIGESYDCIINNDCPGCEPKGFQGNLQNYWPISEKMSAKDGLNCVKKMMQEWKNDRAMQGWKFYAEFIGMDSDGTSDFYSYQVRWSFPTPAYPEPQVTVSVFFTIEAMRKKHRKCPVDVTYVFEGNQFAHRPKMPFRAKWIYDVLDTKTMMFKSFKF